MPKEKVAPWRWKHVPTGMYWCGKYLVVKGLYKAWSNLHPRGRVFTRKPRPSLLTTYYNPEDCYNHRKSAPVRISKPGEWVIEPFLGRMN